MTKSKNFLPIKASYLDEDYGHVYIYEMVKLHGIPFSIILDKGTQLTSHFWRLFQNDLGTYVMLSTLFIHRSIVKSKGLFISWRIC